MMNALKQTFLPDETATLTLGRLLSSSIPADKTPIIYLYGDLGAGKTTLVRGFLNALGHQSPVKSPTYTFVESYDLPNRTIYHFDFYRIENPAQLETIGIRDYFDASAVCLVEWPEKGCGILPEADLHGCLDIKDLGRDITLKAMTENGREILERLRTKLHESKILA